MAVMQGKTFKIAAFRPISRVRAQEASVMERKMFARLNNRFGRAFMQFNSAVQAAAALRVGHQPQKRDLAALGIDVAEFRKIHE